MDTITRWGVLDRINHWLVFLGVVLAIATGLPIFAPSVFGFLNPLLGSRTGLNALVGPHLGGAFLLIAAAALHIIHAATKRKTSMIPTRKDIDDLMAISKHWFNSAKQYPQLGFHHPGEMAIYWGAAVLGIVLLGSSGLVLWFPDSFVGLQTLALIIHDVGFALVTVLIIGHFLLAVAPRNWPLLKAMFLTGSVPIAWAEKHHPQWVKEALITVKARR